jgi:signal transduction histidine kinase
VSLQAHNLRVRIVVSFTAVGAVLGTLFAIACYVAASYIERQFVEATVADELAYFIEQVTANPDAPVPASTNFRGWHATLDDFSPIPDWLRDLAPGLHEIEHAGTWYEIAISDHAGRRYFLVYDESEVERIKAVLVLFLVGGVLGVTFVALWIGVSVADRIIAPVTRLAELVRTADRREEESLASAFADDEVGELARAFDLHAARVRALVLREQELTADASHELRTGLAVIAGTTELLREAPELSRESLGRLERIDRATAGLRRLTEAFLLLARDPSTASGASDAGAVLGELVEQHREAAQRRGRELLLRLEGKWSCRCPLPC